jgi:hypothetical protein
MSTKQQGPAGAVVKEVRGMDQGQWNDRYQKLRDELGAVLPEVRRLQLDARRLNTSEAQQRLDAALRRRDEIQDRLDWLRNEGRQEVAKHNAATDLPRLHVRQENLKPRLYDLIPDGFPNEVYGVSCSLGNIVTAWELHCEIRAVQAMVRCAAAVAGSEIGETADTPEFDDRSRAALCEVLRWAAEALETNKFKGEYEDAHIRLAQFERKVSKGTMPR